MKALLKNIQGSRCLVLICALVTMFTLTVCQIVFFVNGNKYIAAAFAFAGAVVFVFAATVAVTAEFVGAAAGAAAGAGAVAIAFAAAGAAAGVGEFAAAVVAAVMGVVAFAGAAADELKNKFKIRTWKVFAIYLSQAGVIWASMFLPQVALFTLSALALLSGCLLAESGLCLWLRANPPLSLSVERVAPVGIPSFRQEQQVVARHKRPDNFRAQFHRKLYSVYRPN